MCTPVNKMASFFFLLIDLVSSAVLAMARLSSIEGSGWKFSPQRAFHGIAIGTHIEWGLSYQGMVTYWRKLPTMNISILELKWISLSRRYKQRVD